MFCIVLNYVYLCVVNVRKGNKSKNHEAIRKK